MLLFGFGIVGYFIKTWLDNREKCRVVATSILAEINSLIDRYMFATEGGIKDEMTKPPTNGSCTVMVLEIFQDYFVVFDNNVENIGFMEPSDAAIIIDFYVSAKGLVDTYASLYQKNTQFNRMKFEVYKDGKDQDPKILSMMDEMLKELNRNMKQLSEQEKIIFTKANKAREVLEAYVMQNAKFWDFAATITKNIINRPFPF